MSNTTRRFTAGIALLLIGLSLVTAVTLTAPRIVRADPGAVYGTPVSGLDNGSGSWRYMRSIVIDNTANPETLTDYQVLVQFDTQTLVAQGKMNPDGSDIRFTTDFQTFLDYWIESGIQNEFGIGEPDTKVWVKVPLIPGGGTTTIYLLYGNPTASPMSDIQATFVFGDDFNDNSLDPSRWNVVLEGPAQLLEQNQRLEHLSPMGYSTSSFAISTQPFTGPMALELRFRKGGYVYRWFGIRDTVQLNMAEMWIWDWGPVLFRVVQNGTEALQIVEDSFWSRQYNPEYYVQVIRRPDGSFSFNSSVPGFEPGGPKSWSATFTQTLPLDLPMQVYLIDHTWQGAWWLWLRCEDDVRVRRYTEPEPTATVSSPEITIHYAAPTAQGSGDCSSWANACTLQTALAQAVSGDEIWVKAGVYYPGAAGNRTATFSLKNGVALYGGFAGTETLRNQRNWQTNLTILSGDIDQNDNHDGDYINENASQIVGNNAYHVVTGSGTDATASLDGFVITAGQAKGPYPHSRGGGIYNLSGSPTLTNLAFSGNTANYGGGVFNWTSNSMLTNVTFSGNTASYGGGIYNESSSPVLTNVTFGGNSAVYGGGVYNAYYSDPSLGNVVIWGNTAAFGASIHNNNSAPIVSYSDVQGCGSSGGGWNPACGTDGGGNIDADPLFVDAAGGNLRLLSISPAVDAGDNAAVPAGTVTDLGGNPRFVDIPAVPDTGNGTPPIVDMGAYEAQDGTPPTVVSILRADPNPTNAASVRFTITFSEAVQNVDMSDLALTTTGISDASVTAISGGGETYTVTVSTGNGNGTLRLDIPATATIADLAGNPLAGLPYTGGEVYDVDKTAPTVLSILRADPNPTNAASVHFTITFSEAVQNVDVSDLTLNTTGISGASVTGVSGSGDTYTVTVATGTGSGTLRLDIPDTATITDLAGNPLFGLPYTDGEVYEVKAERVRYAAPTAQGSGDCTSWANACTLQTALAQAVSGNEIWVKAGVHYPTTNPAERTATFALKNGVAIYGGFAGTETSRDQRDWQANVTILSGDIDQNDINTDGNYIAETWNDIQGANSYHVVTGSGTDNTALLDGFVVTAGQANGGALPDDRGGGMFTDSGSPFLGNIVFSGNMTSYLGGGLYNIGSASGMTLSGVTFTGNYSALGGGGALTHVNITLIDVKFIANRADLCGGGMAMHDNATLVDVIFSNNSADHGGGLCNWQISRPVLTNVLFQGNTVAKFGGGMYSDYSFPILNNATFFGNSAGQSGGAIHNYLLTNTTIRNSILWGNSAPQGAQISNASASANVTYSIVQGGWPGQGNLDADPLFVDAANGNLRLRPTSPAIDAGNNAAVPGGITTDLDGNPRFVDIPTVPDTGNGTPPIVDMGAYEAQYVDVALSKAVSPQTVAPGQAITFTLTLSNSGESTIPASGLFITDTLPSFLGSLSFTSTLVITDTGYNPPYAWQVQDLTPGQSGVITVSGVLTLPLAAGTYTNTAVIAAAGDLLAENNSAVITFTVPNVAPAFTSTPVITATQDAPYICTATAGDDNGDALTFTAPTLPAWLTLEDHGDGTAALSGTPTNADVGEHAVLLQVTDSGGLSDTQAFTITVANVNDAPFFTSAPVLTATQDVPYTYTITTTDFDLAYGDALTITAPTLPAWLTLIDHGDGTATLSGTPAIHGEYLIVLRVTDSGGLYTEQSFIIFVARRYYSFLPLIFLAIP